MLFRPAPRMVLVLVGAALAACASVRPAAPLADKAPSINARIDGLLAASAFNATTAAAVAARCEEVIGLAGEARDALEKRSGPATLQDDFAAYDSLGLLLGDASGEMNLVSETNTTKEVREAAETCLTRLSDLSAAVSLSRPIYDRLSAIPTNGLDARDRYILDRQLTGYRLSGVDKDEATRARVKELNREITETGLRFDANIREDKGDIVLKPGELAGLPQDYLDSHRPGPDGLVHLTYAYPDILPIRDFADNREARCRVLTAFSNRAYPVNDAVLQSLLEKRYELATLLDSANYAQLITADKMIGSPERAAAFLDRVNDAAEPGAEAEANELQAFAQTLDPSIGPLQSCDVAYMTNKLRKARYDVDESEVRRYLTLDKARAGIFKLVHDLFGSDIRRWNTPVWDPSVTAWEIYDGEKLIGRFYLDLIPRQGKFSHGAAFPLRTGVGGRQLPMAALVTNFPGTGQMSHNDFKVFLHEFGHLLHNLYAGQVRWASQAAFNVQWDFVEAPSQLLEEWAYDYPTLKGFATDELGQPIPEELVRKLNAARHFGEPTFWKRQLGYAAVSLNFYNRKPDFDLLSMFEEQNSRYSTYPLPPGTHGYDNFGHLNGYSAIYYTYIWSKAIALDLFTRFRASGMYDPQTAMRYKKVVLEAGGSEDGNTIIESFLGRPMSLQAFRDELQQR